MKLSFNERIKKLREPFSAFLFFISLTGIFLVLWSLVNFPVNESMSNYLLLLTLAIVAQISTTSVTVAGSAGITFEVSTAVAMATLPVYGAEGAILIVAASSLGIWLIKPIDENTWKRNWGQLSFNTGMWTIAMFLAAQVFFVSANLLGTITILRNSLPWLLAAIVNDQINLWLLLIVLRLQHTDSFNMVNTWREYHWASAINIFVICIGGGLLAFAISQYGWIGIVIFFLPIGLSTLAFALYVRQMQEHLDNLEEIVADRTQELANLLEEKDQFLGILTHDMNTPLTNFSLFLDLLEDHPTILIDEPELIEAMRSSHRSLISIVDNILDLEKLNSGGSLRVKRESFNLAPNIELAVNLMQPQAAKKLIALSYQLTTNSMPIYADHQQIERVLLNLISNAIKYTRTTGKVNINACKENGHFVIVVEDNGYAIPPEELNSIFDRFNRVNKHMHKADGTGLGLAITKALVEAHQGEITVVSEEDVGSTFTVKLPAELPPQ